MSFVFAAVVSCLLVTLCKAQSTENRDIKGYNGIAVDGPFSINLEIGDKEGVTLSGNKDFISNIDTVVENGTLHIRFKDWSLLFTGILQITVRAKTIANIIAAGPAQVTSRDTVKTSLLRVVVSGSAQVIVNFDGNVLVAVVSQSAGLISTVHVKSVSVVLDNSGTVTLSGDTDNVNAVVTRSGVFHGTGLNAVTASVTVNGSGRAEIHASDEIKASAGDDGTVLTSGTTNVVKDTADSGSVEAA